MFHLQIKNINWKMKLHMSFILFSKKVVNFSKQELNNLDVIGNA